MIILSSKEIPNDLIDKSDLQNAYESQSVAPTIYSWVLLYLCTSDHHSTTYLNYISILEQISALSPTAVYV